MLHDDKMTSEEALAHYGVKGMRWGHRTSEIPGVSRKTSKEAAGDAKEFARAKLFYGEGAGTRRKLIKAKVDTKRKQDPNYAKAFDHHFNNQDLGKHAERARGERRRADTRANVRKTGNSINRALNGPFAGSAAIALVGAGAAYAQRNNLGQRAMASARGFAANQNLRREVSDLLRNVG